MNKWKTTQTNSRWIKNTPWLNTAMEKIHQRPHWYFCIFISLCNLFELCTYFSFWVQRFWKFHLQLKSSFPPAPTLIFFAFCRVISLSIFIINMLTTTAYTVLKATISDSHQLSAPLPTLIGTITRCHHILQCTSCGAMMSSRAYGMTWLKT